MSLLLYNIFLLFYRTALAVAARFNVKARLWREGRKDWKARLQVGFGKKKGPVVWMHCASLGEFEQGRPVLEHIRSKYPDYRVVISFFSPSGYEIRKNYAGADHVCYLPVDTAANAKAFIDIVQPDLVLWIRYEFWYHYLTQLQGRNIPVLLISGLFRPQQPFFRWYGRLHRHMLACFKRMFVQDKDSGDLLRRAGFTSVEVSGDTRYDRVSAIAGGFRPLPEIETFIDNRKVVVAGSTWPEDEEELDHFANSHPEYCFIIAPHEVGEAHIKEIEQLFRKTVRYSKWRDEWEAGGRKQEEGRNVLIIDNIGMLSRLYHYASVAYVGGGFGEDGLHNILEPAVYGVPVIHGPVYDRFPEAIALIDAGGSFAVNNALELEELMNELLTGGEKYQCAAEAAGVFVKNRRGATDAIVAYMEANRLLTN